MINPRSWKALLALNVVLLLALILTVLSPPSVQAQQRPRPGEYLLIAGDITGLSGKSAVYIIELRTSRLLALFYNRDTRRIEVIDSRLLDEDLTTTPTTR